MPCSPPSLGAGARASLLLVHESGRASTKPSTKLALYSGRSRTHCAAASASSAGWPSHSSRKCALSGCAQIRLGATVHAAAVTAVQVQGRSLAREDLAAPGAAARMQRVQQAQGVRVGPRRHHVLGEARPDERLIERVAQCDDHEAGVAVQRQRVELIEAAYVVNKDVVMALAQLQRQARPGGMRPVALCAHTPGVSTRVWRALPPQLVSGRPGSLGREPGATWAPLGSTGGVGGTSADYKLSMHAACQADA